MQTLMPRFKLQAGLLVAATAIAFGTAGCSHQAPPPPQQGPLPVGVMTVSLANVPRSDDFVATIKSRQSATIQPQVDGNLTSIAVHSGQAVKAGQLLMQIDPARQAATVQSQKATAQQKLAVYKLQQIEVERQRKLFADGIVSRDALDQAEQSYENSKADYESAMASTTTQEKQLGYYRLVAPISGIVGDVPVHLGDYVTPSTVLTTVDSNGDLEAYIYVPTEKALDIRMGLPVQLLDQQGNVLDTTAIDFVSPQVDNGLQGVLVKAPVHSSSAQLRNLEIVRARVIWSTSPQPVVPVLAVTRVGGQPFVFVAQKTDKGTIAHQQAVQLGDTLGNVYDVTSGLKDGDMVIVSGTQFLVDGMPVQPMTGPPPAH